MKVRIFSILGVAFLLGFISVTLGQEKEKKVEQAQSEKVEQPQGEMIFMPIIKLCSDVTTEGINACGNGISACGKIAGSTSRFAYDLLTDPTRFTDVTHVDTSGLALSTSATTVYQQNVHGGLSTHNKRGRFAGRYQVELAGETAKLLGIENGGFYLKASGAWSESGDITGPSIGSKFDINDKCKPRRSMDLEEAWYQHNFLDGKFSVRIGKMDPKGGFACDGRAVAFAKNAFASSSTSQFLNSALCTVKNIPFPQNGLGVALFYNHNDFWYIAGEITDADADSRETGFNTAFHGTENYFSIFETGIVPKFNSDNGVLTGAYRLGMWYDPKPKRCSGATKYYRDDTGLYVDIDQDLIKENNDEKCRQGLGTFFRYGLAEGKKNDVTNFWSFGFQYRGLFEGRDSDVMGIGFASGVFSDSSSTYKENQEDIYELYYNIKVAKKINLTPSVQYIKDPGGKNLADDALAIGLRLHMTF